MKNALPDFKTERTDVLAPLPAPLRIVPLGFYLSVLGLAGIAAYSFHGTKKLKDEAGEFRGQIAQEQAGLKALIEAETKLNQNAKNARDVQNWVAGSTEVYPLVLRIARSVDTDTTIAELNLSRLDDNPAHLRMDLRYNSARGNEPGEELVQTISDALNLRPYGVQYYPSDADLNDVRMECNWAPATVASNTDK